MDVVLFIEGLRSGRLRRPQAAQRNRQSRNDLGDFPVIELLRQEGQNGFGHAQSVMCELRRHLGGDQGRELAGLAFAGRSGGKAPAFQTVMRCAPPILGFPR